MKKKFFFLIFVALLSFLVSCHVGSPDGPCEVTSSGLNAQGETVLVCEKFHANAPYIRLDKSEGGYMGGLNSEGLFTFLNANHVLETVRLVYQDGKPYACMMQPSDTLQANGCDPVTDGKVSERRIYTLYKVEGVLDSAQQILTTSSIRPYLVATPSAIDSLLNRPYVGSANFRKAAFNPEVDGIISYEEDSAPILLMPLRQAPARHIGHDGNADAPLEKTQPTVFQVANYSAPVQGPDGTCFPSLTAWGQRNPLRNMKTNEVVMSRHPSMHLPGEHTLTLEPVDREYSQQDGWAFAIGSGAMSDNAPRVMFEPATWLSAPIDLTAQLAQVQRIHGVPNGLAFKLIPAAQDSRTGKTCP